MADTYAGAIVTGSDEHRAILADLAAMTLADLRQTHRLAPAASRLRCLADAEIGRRAARRLRTAPVPASFAVPARPRTDSREEL